MNVLETERLRLRWLTAEDAPFYLELINEPGWHKYIGDKGVRTVEAARESMLKGPIAMYQRLGFGLYMTELKDGTPIGICGLIKRDTLEDVDLGFAFLERHQGRGYALEAARASLDHAREDFDLGRIVAITSLDNERSIRLLEKLDFMLERVIQLTPDDAGTKLFGRRL